TSSKRDWSSDVCSSDLRSVASSVTFSPSISTRTLVRIGSVSSFEVAIVTWETAFWNSPADTVPESSGTCGRAGYSATGMVISENREDPQVTSTFVSICSRVTSWFGRALEMSASSRPETRTVPAETTSAAISTREETSWLQTAERTGRPGSAVMRIPVRTGAEGRLGRVLVAQVTASARTSRLTLNFKGDADASAFTLLLRGGHPNCSGHLAQDSGFGRHWL